MVGRILRILSGLGFLLQTATAQSLRGVVVSAETGEPIGFTLVTLYPNLGKQFTDAAGAFASAHAKSGKYILSVRQIGYAPLDTQIVVTGDSTTIVRVALRHLAIELPPVTIAGRQCTSPGRPDSSDAALAVVFDQLQENARRFELFADSYPFRFRLERTLRDVTLRSDMLKPGHVLSLGNHDSRPYALVPVHAPVLGTASDLHPTHLTALR